MTINPDQNDNDDLQHQSNHNDDDDQVESDETEHDELLDEQAVHVLHRPDSSPVPTSCPEIDELEDASQAIELSSDRASPAVSQSAEREDHHPEETLTMPMGYGLRSKHRALSAAPEATVASQPTRSSDHAVPPQKPSHIAVKSNRSAARALPTSPIRAAVSTSTRRQTRDESQLPRSAADTSPLATKQKRTSFVKSESRVSQICLDPFGRATKSKRKSLDSAVDPSIRKAASRGRPRKVKEERIDAMTRPAAVAESSTGTRRRRREDEEERMARTAKARAALAEKVRVKKEKQESKTLRMVQEERGREEGGRRGRERGRFAEGSE
ncbi:hypothetical protein PHSY_003622 [Pseudozyma hubeiensis SY62]|uniref:Uncharacterized protein n=1 Tax=Pseudozyma hubeiensis (strain SY62) TaxID=1305764 RepID=R9P3L2_PSEHS|nr:hypothetical protein PHSY_003622 [Pseudozyma hubeiensis SY62]GAC96043.1 hypothetical protein PHSY_003622 [Pseudozyma hubeiensis SY62]